MLFLLLAHLLLLVLLSINFQLFLLVSSNVIVVLRNFYESFFVNKFYADFMSTLMHKRLLKKF